MKSSWSIFKTYPHASWIRECFVSLFAIYSYELGYSLLCSCQPMLQLYNLLWLIIVLTLIVYLMVVLKSKPYIPCITLKILHIKLAF